MTIFTDDTAEQRKTAKRLRDIGRQKERLRKDALNQLYQTKEGRTFLYTLLEMTGAIGLNAFTPDPLQTAFICGKQSIGQALMAEMQEANPEGFSALLLEMSNDGRYYTNEQHRTSGPGSTGIQLGAGSDIDDESELGERPTPGGQLELRAEDYYD